MNDVSLQQMIYEIRGQRVMLDSDLAKLYEIESKVLNQAVKRNINRFPPDFMFQLNFQEVISLRSQIVTSNRGGRRYSPYAFTEHGVAMLSSVLRSDKAVQVNINIIRAFIEMRNQISSVGDTMLQIRELKQMLMMHIDHDEDRFNKVNSKINQIIQVLNYMQEAPKKEYKIGFNIKKE